MEISHRFGCFEESKAILLHVQVSCFAFFLHIAIILAPISSCYCHDQVAIIMILCLLSHNCIVIVVWGNAH